MSGGERSSGRDRHVSGEAEADLLVAFVNTTCILKPSGDTEAMEWRRLCECEYDERKKGR